MYSRRRLGWVGVWGMVLTCSMAQAADMGTAFTFQGRLENDTPPVPVTDTCDFRFGLWDAPAPGGNQKGNSPQTLLGVSVDAGLFTVVIDFGAAAIDGTARWLAMEVKCPLNDDFILLSPRVELTPAPHALALPGLRTQQNATSPNLIGGYSGNTVTAAIGATISGGGQAGAENSVTSTFGTVGGGDGNTASGPRSTVGGGDSNTASGDRGTVGGGGANHATGDYATVSGGSSNTASGGQSTVGGGIANTASGNSSIVGGGENNTASNHYATVGGGALSEASGTFSTVGGGFSNTTSAERSTVGGGEGNTASNFYCTVGGGYSNTASGGNSTVGGGYTNTASGQSSTVGGGLSNTASDDYSTVGGGVANTASGPYSTTGGGGWNIATIDNSTVGGGTHNTASGYQSTVGGGYNNTASELDATVGGGGGNTASSSGSTVGGGAANTASGYISTIGGGGGNTASADYSTVGGGNSNTASGYISTIGGGKDNTASDLWSTVGGGEGNWATANYSTVSGGNSNTASGEYSTVGGGATNTASGTSSTVPGGYSNEVGGDYSFAAGRQAHVRGIALGDAADDDGTFIWADNQGLDFFSSGINQFLIRAAGGVGMGTASATAPRAQLDVVKSGNTVAVFDRTTSDGTIISLRQAGTEEGTISVAGAIVSYNAFTGSHYGWTDEAIARGALVTLTGVNRSSHDNPESERIYGIAPTTKANDPQCLGAYLGLLEPAKPQTSENPHQVMAVGNGDMWVVDTGRNIEPGQYLISSDLRGHAMLDDEAHFPVGYVIARAGEPVDWTKVNESVDGHKHKKISVFFESFERGSAVAVGKSVAAQQEEIDALKARVATLERALTANAPSSRPVSLASIGGLAIPALALLGFVGLIVRARSRNGGGR